MSRRAVQLGLCLLLCACGERDEIALQYTLSAIDLSDVVRVETYLAVDPGDGRAFFADAPYRSVASGVGYEVRDFDGSGQRKVLVTHDATLGFVFTNSFTFTLLPPSSEAAPPLIVTARAVGPSAMLGSSGDLPTHFALGGHLKVPLTDTRCNGVACASDELCCDNQCVHPAGDAKNCGGCGKDCAPTGDTCQGANCLCAGGSACASPKICCNLLGCVDLDNDPFNCGGCGQACNPGESCSAGACTCNGATACGDNGLCCSDSGCSTSGSCACGVMPCAAPNVCCNASTSSCLNLLSDNANCGTCGHVCGAGLQCQNGACTCAGQICSSSDMCCSTGCADTTNSTTNCGGCGVVCPANETCSGGACKCGSTSCSTGQSCCGTACRDLMGDAMNCGSCGKACNAGEMCMSGHCVCAGTQPARACTSSETCCPSSGNGAGGCFDLTSNQNHCRQCSQACTATQQCLGGVCTQTSCNPPCTNGNTCNPNTLTCQCNGSAGCADPQVCCGTGCVNVLTDPKNCGSCKNDVTPNLCCNGTSTAHTESSCVDCKTPCQSDEFCCADPSSGAFACVLNDVNNCGACGNICGKTMFGASSASGGGLGPTCCTCGRQGTCAPSGVACTLNVCEGGQPDPS